MMLFPSMVLPSRLTRICEAKRVAVWTNFAAARACRPSRLRITTSWLVMASIQR